LVEFDDQGDRIAEVTIDQLQGFSFCWFFLVQLDFF